MKGILTPLITPLIGQDILDTGALQKTIDHVIAGGVHGIFLLGTTGEGPNLSVRLRHEIVKQAAKMIRARVPFYVNVTGQSYTENLALAKGSAEAGATAAVYSGPLYAPIGQDALAAHVERFAAKCPLPLLLYNMPSHTHLFFEVETLKRLAKLSNIIGLKDSSGDILYLQRAVRTLGPNFPVFVGPEEMLLQCLMTGACGGVNGGSNLMPHLYVGIYNAFQAKNFAEAARLQCIVNELSDAIYGQGYLKGLKAAMATKGLCGPAMAEPATTIGDCAAQRIAEAIRDPRFAL